MASALESELLPWISIAGFCHPVSSGLTNVSVNGVQNTMTVKPSDANGFLIFKNAAGGGAGVRSVTGKGKTVYLPFEAGNITPTAMRDTVIRRIFDWFKTASAVSEPVAATTSGLSASQNPFTSSTNITYVGSANEASVSMSVVDLLGREVMRLAPVHTTSNTHTATVYGSRLATGAYHVVVRSSAGMKQMPVMITR